MRLALVTLLLLPFLLQSEEPDKQWAYKRFTRPAVPEVKAKDRVRNPIDAFLLARLEAKGLSFAPEADKETLLRRVTFALTGLPPTPEERDAFLKDASKDAYAKVVDRLLASPAYGEKAALPWLDLARYAESDGFKADDYRPNAWRYRDYVIEAMNADKPYDRFLKEQLAGDELFPDEPAALVATGFLRHTPYEYNAINVEQRRQEMLFDITDVTAQAFLGLTVGCAKCHDHKFDPITQEDYYRLSAFFAGFAPVDVPMLDKEGRAKYEAAQKAWDAKTAEVRAELEAVIKPHRDSFCKKRRSRFPDEYATLLDIPEEKRTPMQKQIAWFVEKQVFDDEKAMMNGIKGADKDKVDALKKKLEAFGPPPAAPAMAIGFTDIGVAVPETRLLKRGNWRVPREEVAPGFLSEIDDRTADVTPTKNTSGRRTALANWLTDPTNPLTARVEVNRLWIQHFGKGIVRTPADFGTQGEAPTHPELLNWLASEFINQKWSIKAMHRLIVTSAAFMQSSLARDEGTAKDPENHLLWRMNRLRLEGETMRDAMLSAAGKLNAKQGGPSVYPELPAEVKVPSWKPNAKPEDQNRRSIYVAVKRNNPFPLFRAFDGTDRCEACSQRFNTITPSQALALLNEKQVTNFAVAMAERIKKEQGEDAAKQVKRAYVLALCREPNDMETKKGAAFLEKYPLATYCHVLMNLNEFIYVD